MVAAAPVVSVFTTVKSGVCVSGVVALSSFGPGTSVVVTDARFTSTAPASISDCVTL